MAEVKWIKIVTDIFDDEKILLIESMPEADSIIVIWFKLLCLAGKQNNSGVFLFNERMPYTDEMLATIFRRNINTVRLALNTFEQFGMIEVLNDTYVIPNWSKHQSLDQIENKNEYMKNYMKKYREKQKLLANGECKTNSKTNSKTNVSSLEEERDIDIDKDNICNTRFTPPSLEEVAEYCKSRSNNIDPQRFIDFYSSKGWMIGKNKMKDWKAAIRNWERNNKKDEPEPKPKRIVR